MVVQDYMILQYHLLKKNISKNNEKSNIIIIINDRSINNDKNLLDKSISNYNVENLLDLNKNGPLEIYLVILIYS